MTFKEVRPAGNWIAALLFLYPLVALTVHDAGNGIYYIFAVSSLVLLAFFRPQNNFQFSTLLKDYWPLHLALASSVLAVLLNQLWSGHFALKYYDRALRLALFPLIFWIVLLVPLDRFRWLRWGFFGATLIMMVKAFVLTQGGQFRFGNIGFLSIIAYSDIAMLTGVLCVISLGAEARQRKTMTVLMVLACIAGAYTGVLTATRGGWVAVPLYLIFFFLASGFTWRQKICWVAGTALVVLMMFSVNQQARSRLDGTQSDLISYSQGEGRTTATGIRLQLWSAALKLFSQQPVFGIGRENYGPSIKAMADRNEVTQELTSLAHSHNEILFNMAISGIFGLLSTLSVYLVPGYYFVRELKSQSAQVRSAAQSGCVVVISFFAFGLTDLMFFWPVLCGYYVILISIFLATIIKAGQQEKKPEQFSAPA